MTPPQPPSLVSAVFTAISYQTQYELAYQSMIVPSDDAASFLTMATQGKTKLVAIVDDDDLMRSALQGMLKSVGLPVASVCVGGGIPELRPAAPDCMSDRGYPHAGNVRAGIAGQTER